MASPEGALVAAALDASGIGLAQVDPRTGCIAAVNTAFCTLSGYPEEELQGLHLGRLNPEGEPFDPQIFAQALDAEVVPTRQRRIVRRDGAVIWVQLNGHVVRDGDGRALRVLAIVQDIDERHRTQQALAEREAHLAFTTRLNDRLRRLEDPVEMTREAARMLREATGVDRVGYAEDAGDGHTLTVTWAHDAGMPALDSCMRYADYSRTLRAGLLSGRPVWQEDVTRDAALSAAEKAAQARLRIQAWLAVPLPRGGRLGSILFAHCRAAHRWAPAEVNLFEEVAQRLRADLARARTEAVRDAAVTQERARVARELHDDLQQRLALVLLESATVRRALGDAPSAAGEALSHIEAQARHVLASATRIIRGLKPLDVETLGLMDALGRLAEQFTGTGALACTVEVQQLQAEDDANFGEAAVTLYRIAQEALTNAVRHGHARRVRIRLAHLGRAARPTLRLVIADDGVGLPEGSAPPHDGSGLAGIQERVVAAGGTLQVRSRTGRGTTVEVQLPALTPQAAPDAPDAPAAASAGTAGSAGATQAAQLRKPAARSLRSGVKKLR